MSEIVAVSDRELLQPAESLDSLLERFLSSQDVSLSSRQTYRRQLRQFRLWLEETGRLGQLDRLQREDILSYKEHLLASHSSRTVSGYLTPVRKFFEWLEAERIYPNIARSVKGAKRPKGFAKDVLSKEQLRAILAGLEPGSRDYALFNLMARTGLRTIELQRASIGDIRQISGQAVLYVQGKGRSSKDDFVLLTDRALQPLKQYLAARAASAGRKLGEDEPLFSSDSDRSRGQALTARSISYLVKQALRRAGLDDGRLTAHSLRHTAITLSVLGGSSLHQVQAMARHSDPKTTDFYFHNLQRVTAGAELAIDF